jgi:putative membrane protein
MYGSEFSGFPYWWIFPLAMIALCFFMMRRRGGSMMCGFGSHKDGDDQVSSSDSAMDILDKRFATGEINKEAYEEKKKTLNQRN